MSKHINFIINEELYMFNIGRHYCEAELFLLLQIKYYIFSCKRLNVPLSIVAFKNRLSLVFKSCEYIAQKNKNLHKFEKDWIPLMLAFS